MEAAGIMTRIPVAVIRGISDFVDSSKNDSWQPYAAITAAAYAKEVLTKLPSEARGSCPGREAELGYLDEELGLRAQQPLQKSIAAVWGIIGVGKSQLASRFVHQQRSKHPEREIFWVNGETQEAFEQSVAMMLSEDVRLSGKVQTKSPQKEAMDHVHTFFNEVSRLKDQRWLLVIDGINEKPFPSSPDRWPFSVHGLIRNLKRYYILLTARRRDVIEEYHPNRELKGLTIEDAANLLRSRVDARLIEAGVEELGHFFKGHPLTLRLAASILSSHHYTAIEYLDKWKDHEIDENPTIISKYLFLPIEQSFRELESTDPIAAKVLTLFSYLDYKDLWYELCLIALEETYPTWLCNHARERKSFRSFCPILADLSFIELKHTVDGHQLWEIRPAIQAVARQSTNTNEQEYIQCAIPLVAAHVPRSYEHNFWQKIRRLEPHATR
ncbi:P-loop containing nucleoside triphosphate hydrolase protein [Aspergillus flavus]|uniref:P-loop containing nucleoside triphosphate hydrolase protein n=1 Tax=Aspergillus flavus (strain ATCC 200026 / FGSC A1120 / IAM 13836 / NRRL 3357 / JCM 12722 / SRRC 167) TaxID=332952 RepID=A0A7U2MVC1_ASPFN|nr:P-loop containing nucleoside triphosphate hydrolase protein [Aspergillus flavus]